MQKLEVLGPGPKADPWIPKGRSATGQLGRKLQKKAEMQVDDSVPQEASVESKVRKEK